MSKSAREITDEFFSAEISPEITHDEAVAFLKACPYPFISVKLLLATYILGCSMGQSPYQSLKGVIRAYIQGRYAMKKELVPGNLYYCIPLGENVTFLYWDNGYVVVETKIEHKYWMKYEDLEELHKDE